MGWARRLLPRGRPAFNFGAPGTLLAIAAPIATKLVKSGRGSDATPGSEKALAAKTAVVATPVEERDDASKLRAMLRPDAGRLATGVFHATVATVAALGMPLAFANVVTELLSAAVDTARLAKAVALVGCLYVVEPAMTFLYVRQMTQVAEGLVTRLKLEALHSVLSQEMVFFDKRGFGEVTAAVTSDVRAVKQAVQMNLQRDRGLRAVLETVLGLVVLTKLQPRLAWIFAIIVPAVASLLADSRKKLAQLAEVEGVSLGREAAITAEAVRNIREVRSFGTEGKELGRFKVATMATSTTAARAGAAAGRLEALNRLAIYATILGVVWFGGRQVAAGRMTAPLLVSFIGYCFSLNFAIQGVNFTIADAKRAKAALGRVLQVMDRPSVPRGGGEEGDEEKVGAGLDVIPPEEFRGRVEFRKVHFAYPTRADLPVFQGLQLTVPAGKVTALVGPSGAGKSTITALLSRFYSPSRGEILVDGVDIRDLDRRWLTQKIALVGQNPALFTGSIASNIAYGVRCQDPEKAGCELNGASMDKVVEAAKMANAHEFILAFPEGYDTLVGEGGVQLSGGQRQRVAIARAILKDARILVLDEATSALDAQSEALVQEALERLMHGRTVLVIAHRLSTVVNADKICAVSRGQVVEEGTHGELLLRKGMYAQLMRTQVSSYSVIGE